MDCIFCRIANGEIPSATVYEDGQVRVMAVGARIGEAQMKAFGADGFNLIQNNGEAAGQSVFHLHLHVIPRKEGDGAVGLWKPGKTTPEEMNETAEAIRKELF